MKPHELITALMLRDGMGRSSSVLARKLKAPKMQSQLHRFLQGKTTEPARTTVQPMAQYWKLPIDAFYDEKVSTRLATEMALQMPPPVEPKPPRNKPKAEEGVALLATLRAADPVEYDKVMYSLERLVDAVQASDAALGKVVKSGKVSPALSSADLPVAPGSPPRRKRAPSSKFGALMTEQYRKSK